MNEINQSNIYVDKYYSTCQQRQQPYGGKCSLRQEGVILPESWSTFFARLNIPYNLKSLSKLLLEHIYLAKFLERPVDEVLPKPKYYYVLPPSIRLRLQN